jgi:hypothetical protein
VAKRKAKEDLGGSVVDHVFETMQIDDEWSIREAAGFTWWGHRLAQRVWADPPRKSFGENVVCLHAEMDLLQGVPNTPETLGLIASANQLATLNALVFDPEGGRVSLRCNAYFHEGNLWLQQIFSSAVALQVAQAHVEMEALTEMLGGEPLTSEHPTSGERPEPDDMLNVGAIFTHHGADSSPFVEADFTRVLEMEPKPWLMATGSGAGLTAEFAFGDGVPAILRSGSNQTGDQPLGTALFQATAEQEHPHLGSGCLLQLHLPMNLRPDSAAGLANELNVSESREWSAAHLLGAWYSRGSHVSFTAFLPAMVVRSHDSLSRQILVFNSILTMARRAQWAREQCDALSIRVQALHELQE